MIDHKERQLSQMHRERRAFIEECGQDTFVLKCRRKEYPAGSTWMWAVGGVFGPVNSAAVREAAE